MSCDTCRTKSDNSRTHLWILVSGEFCPDHGPLCTEQQHNITIAQGKGRKEMSKGRKRRSKGRKEMSKERKEKKQGKEGKEQGKWQGKQEKEQGKEHGIKGNVQGKQGKIRLSYTFASAFFVAKTLWKERG